MLALLLGAGCDASVDPIQVAAGCPERPLRGPLAYVNEPRNHLIDDFETNTDALANVDGRNGLWVLGADGSSGNLHAEPSGLCAARDLYAGHFAGQGFTRWGANWTAVFEQPSGGTAVPYDASKYSGISFWAAFGGQSGPDFVLSLGVTTMDNAWNGHICQQACMDYYRTRVALTHDWTRFFVRFASMAQEGTGSPLLPMRKDQMVGFILWPTQSQFDIWIDDVRFEP
jgi:hypothetical protein